MNQFLTVYAGIYIISSILYLDPWHILHSMLSYLLIAPAFTNILVRLVFRNLISFADVFASRMSMVRLQFSLCVLIADLALNHCSLL